MPDQKTSASTHSRLDALLVPADPHQPTKVIDLNDGASRLDILQHAVRGTIEVQAHDEGDIYLNEVGRLIDLPINVRINHWLVNNSRLAHEHHVSESLIIYGDVVMTGPPDRNGNETPVSQDLIDHFQSLNLAPDAMKDWDIRSTDITITFIDPSGPHPNPGDVGFDL